MISGSRPGACEVAAIAANAAFGRPLVTNVHRGLIAEAIISTALAPEWSWCSADYSAWDFERSDKARLEVKQAASLHSWHRPGNSHSRIVFDIRARQGRYDDTVWMSQERRWADIYIFAHHHVTTSDADHRLPDQWAFYVALERHLPVQKTISLSRLQKTAAVTTFTGLRNLVSRELAG